MVIVRLIGEKAPDAYWAPTNKLICSIPAVKPTLQTMMPKLVARLEHDVSSYKVWTVLGKVPNNWAGGDLQLGRVLDANEDLSSEAAITQGAFLYFQPPEVSAPQHPALSPPTKMPPPPPPAVMPPVSPPPKLAVPPPTMPAAPPPPPAPASKVPPAPPVLAPPQAPPPVTEAAEGAPPPAAPKAPMASPPSTTALGALPAPPAPPTALGALPTPPAPPEVLGVSRATPPAPPAVPIARVAGAPPSVAPPVPSGAPKAPAAPPGPGAPPPSAPSVMPPAAPPLPAPIVTLPAAPPPPGAPKAPSAAPPAPSIVPPSVTPAAKAPAIPPPASPKASPPPAPKVAPPAAPPGAPNATPPVAPPAAPKAPPAAHPALTGAPDELAPSAAPALTVAPPAAPPAPFAPKAPAAPPAAPKAVVPPAAPPAPKVVPPAAPPAAPKAPPAAPLALTGAPDELAPSAAPAPSVAPPAPFAPKAPAAPPASPKAVVPPAAPPAPPGAPKLPAPAPPGAHPAPSGGLIASAVPSTTTAPPVPAAPKEPAAPSAGLPAHPVASPTPPALGAPEAPVVSGVPPGAPIAPKAQETPGHPPAPAAPGVPLTLGPEEAPVHPPPPAPMVSSEFPGQHSEAAAETFLEPLSHEKELENAMYTSEMPLDVGLAEEWIPGVIANPDLATPKKSGRLAEWVVGGSPLPLTRMPHEDTVPFIWKTPRPASPPREQLEEQLAAVLSLAVPETPSGVPPAARKTVELLRSVEVDNPFCTTVAQQEAPPIPTSMYNKARTNRRRRRATIEATVEQYKKASAESVKDQPPLRPMSPERMMRATDEACSPARTRTPIMPPGHGATRHAGPASPPLPALVSPRQGTQPQGPQDPVTPPEKRGTQLSATSPRSSPRNREEIPIAVAHTQTPSHAEIQTEPLEEPELPFPAVSRNEDGSWIVTASNQQQVSIAMQHLQQLQPPVPDTHAEDEWIDEKCTMLKELEMGNQMLDEQRKQVRVLELLLKNSMESRAAVQHERAEETELDSEGEKEKEMEEMNVAMLEWKAEKDRMLAAERIRKESMREEIERLGSQLKDVKVERERYAQMEVCSSLGDDVIAGIRKEEAAKYSEQLEEQQQIRSMLEAQIVQLQQQRSESDKKLQFECEREQRAKNELSMIETELERLDDEAAAKRIENQNKKYPKTDEKLAAILQSDDAKRVAAVRSILKRQSEKVIPETASPANLSGMSDSSFMRSSLEAKEFFKWQSHTTHSNPTASTQRLSRKTAEQLLHTPSTLSKRPWAAKHLAMPHQ